MNALTRRWSWVRTGTGEVLVPGPAPASTTCPNTGARYDAHTYLAVQFTTRKTSRRMMRDAARYIDVWRTVCHSDATSTCLLGLGGIVSDKYVSQAIFIVLDNIPTTPSESPACVQLVLLLLLLGKAKTLTSTS